MVFLMYALGLWIFSLIYNYIYVRILYSSKGKKSKSKVHFGVVMTTFFPVLNTMMMLYYVFGPSPYNYNHRVKNFKNKKPKKERNWSWFFLLGGKR
jgi:hypothetical protein